MLSIQHGNDGWAADVERLYSALSRLREQKWWRECVAGGAVFFEAKRGADGLPHPHFHLICTGNFIPREKLQEGWRKATNGSFVTDVRVIREPERVAKYVVGYTTKGLHDSLWESDDELAEVMRALHGRKLAWCFGDWREWSLLDSKRQAGEWRQIGRLSDIVEQGRAGNLGSRALLLNLLGREDRVEQLLSRTYKSDRPGVRERHILNAAGCHTLGEPDG